jgi:type I restriction enzyme S subunit
MKGGWQSKTLGEVAEVFDGPHATPRTVDSGPIFLGITALQDGTINLGETRHVTAADFTRWTRRVKPQADDVVFSYETKLGEAAIIPEGLECCLGRRMGLVRFHTGTMIPRFFLYQYLSPAFRQFLESRTIHGATVDRISIKEFPSFPVAVPPLPEQRLIVGILDEAFEGVAISKANAEKNLANARVIFESYLESVFTHRSGAWVHSKLKSITTKIGSGATPRGGEESYKADGISLIRSLNVHDLGFRYPKLAFLDDAQADELSNVEVQPRDVLLNITGASVARCCVVPDDVLPARVNQHVSIIRPMAKELDPAFLHFLLISKPFKDQLLRTGEGGGSTRQAITKAQILDLSVEYPATLKGQDAIVARLDSLLKETQRLASIYQRKLAALEALKKSLLHEAFGRHL